MTSRWLRFLFLVLPLISSFTIQASPLKTKDQKYSQELIGIASDLASNEDIDIIIFLSSQAVSERILNAENIKESSIRDYDNQVDLYQREFIKKLKERGYILSLRNRIRYVTNIVSIKTKTNYLPLIAEFDEVKTIAIDSQKSASSTNEISPSKLNGFSSPNHLFANSKTPNFNGKTLTGKGVKVAILGNGVNYQHAELGGCIGPTCKVVAGHALNFQNDLSDFSQYNVDTQVAGIIAANGPSLTGIAPEASLYIFSIYSSSGYTGASFRSAVFEGIDWALNPDGDPTTKDNVDILHVNLNTQSDLNQWAESVKRATDFGTIVVAPSGTQHDTIVPPAELNKLGISEDIVLVGSTNENREVSTYSPKGPIEQIPFFEIHDYIRITKPDITALGENIISTYGTNELREFSGTFAAAAVVTGKLALLKQAFPHLNPRQLKSKLMLSSNDLNMSPLFQGAGLIEDLTNALESTLTLSHGHLNFGATDASVPVWSKSIPIEVSNTSLEEESINLSLVDNLPIGINLSFNNTDFKLNPGETKTFEATLEVDNSIIHYPSFEDSGIFGSINITSSTRNSLTLPFSFYLISSTKFKLNEHIDIENWGLRIAIYKDGKIFKRKVIVNLKTDKVVEIPIENGVFDFVLNWEDIPQEGTQRRIIEVIEQVKIDANSPRTFEWPISSSKLSQLDIQVELPNETISINGDELINADDENFSFHLVGYLKGEKITEEFLFIDNMDAKFLVPETYSFNGVLSIIKSTEGTTIEQSRVDKEDLHFPIVIDSFDKSIIPVHRRQGQNIRLRYKHGAVLDSNYPFIMHVHRYFGDGNSFISSINSNDLNRIDIRLNDIEDYSFTSFVEANKDFKGIQRYTRHSLSTNAFGYAFSPILRLDKDKNLEFYNAETKKIYKRVPLKQLSHISIGQLPPYWGGKIVKNDDMLSLSFLQAGNGAYFSDATSSYWLGTVSIYDGFETVDSKCNGPSFPSGISSSSFDNDGKRIFNRSFPTDFKLTEEIKNLTICFKGARFNKRKAQALVRLKLNPKSSDFSPPYFTTLETKSGNTLSEILPASDDSQVQFMIEDDHQISSVNMSIRKHSPTLAGEWQTLSGIDTSAKFSLDDTWEKGDYDLRVTATDSSGNSVQYELSPAFIVGSCDFDPDCDGVPSQQDIDPFNPWGNLDSDNDGIADFSDNDDDNDGVPDEIDSFPLDSSESSDFDVDGIGDNSDLDDDNDGFQDIDDQFPKDPNEWLDSDNDGIGDNSDQTPFNISTIDFNGDGIDDILYRNKFDLTWRIDLMNSHLVNSISSVSEMSTCCGWVFNGIGDFNSDGISDIIIRNENSGSWYVYYMKNSKVSSKGKFTSPYTIDFDLKSIADFNNDGYSDVLVRNENTGSWKIALLNNQTIIEDITLPMSKSLSWKLIDVNDFDGNGSVDVLIRNKSSGSWYVFLFEDTRIIDQGYIKDLPNDLNFKVKSTADYNNDGKADVLTRHISSFKWISWHLDGRNLVESFDVPINDSPSWEFNAAGDYNGDGFTDVTIRNLTSQQVYIYLLGNKEVLSQGYTNELLSDEYEAKRIAH